MTYPCILCIDDQEKQCGARAPDRMGFLCTMPKGHIGEHAACGTLDKAEAHPYVTWADGESKEVVEARIMAMVRKSLEEEHL